MSGNFGLGASVDGVRLARTFSVIIAVLAGSGHLFGLLMRRYRVPLATMLSAS